MAEVVLISDLDSYIALAVEKVNNGVALARDKGVQAELPPKLDFEVIVITGWQALEEQGSEKGLTKETGGTTDTGDTRETTTGKDTGKTVEVNGGYQSETSVAATADNTNSTEKRDSAGENHHTQNTDETVTVTES